MEAILRFTFYELRALNLNCMLLIIEHVGNFDFDVESNEKYEKLFNS
jgi:hypothetical protein